MSDPILDLLTGVLCVLTALYVYVTYRASNILEAQTEATRRSADAAKQSADVFIKSERAWVMVDLRWADRPKIVETISNGIRKISIEVCLVCQNDGRTPAWILERLIWFRVVDSLDEKPETTQPPSWVEIGTDPVNVGASSTKKIELECEGAIRSGLAKVIYGHVKYRDVFKPDRETWFGYALILSHQGDRLDRLAGYPEYDRST
jgi:hypothetical protein